MELTIIPLKRNEEEKHPFMITKKMSNFGETNVIQVDKQMYVTVGMDQETYTQENLRFIGGKVRKKLIELEASSVARIDFQCLDEMCQGLTETEVVTGFLEGWKLAGYTFTTYKKKKEKIEVTLQFDQEKYAEALAQAEHTAEAVNTARDLCNEPANKLTPALYAERLRALFANTNAEVEIIETDELHARGFHATAVVGAESNYEPKVAIITLKNADTKHVALVGKGITFDSGGTNVKTASDIGEMKMDMGGSAAVVGAMKLLTDQHAPVHVTAIIPLATNVAGGKAFLPSDVITYRSGTTVEVGNTDAEGRLVLADGILHAQEVGAEMIIDIATLTGTIGQALGLKTAGIFSNDEAILWDYKALGDQTGDYVWPMPITKDYQTYIDSNTADINNMSTSPFGGAITAALFLQHFVEEGKKWIHIDMANTVRPWKIDGYHVTGAAGFGVRLLAEMVMKG